MSVSVTISGEIIESQNYLSNYFVTINSDQTISGTKTFNIENVSSMNASSLNASTLNATTLNASTLNASTLVSDTLTTISLNTSSLNANALNSSSINANALNTSTLNARQINASSLDLSTLTFNGAPFSQTQPETQIFGTSDISSNLVNGTILFGKTFDSVPSVVISQYSTSRIVPICVTNVSTTAFNWASSSNNVGKINWSAGIKF